MSEIVGVPVVLFFTFYFLQLLFYLRWSFLLNYRIFRFCCFDNFSKYFALVSYSKELLEALFQVLGRELYFWWLVSSY